MQVEAAYLLVVFLSATTSASWIFPDRSQSTRDSRDLEGEREDLKLLSLVSGQPSYAATPNGLALLRHLLQLQRKRSKVTRSLDTHTRLINPPSGSSINRGSLASPHFTLSHHAQSCCTGSGFKPSTYFTSTAYGKNNAAAHNPITTTSSKPIQTFNAINIYKPIFNSPVITTRKPALTFDDITVPYQYTHTTTATPTIHAYNTALNAITTNKLTPTIYRDTNNHFTYKDTTTTITTYKPKFNNNKISDYMSSTNNYKPASTTYTQISSKKPHHLPRRDHHTAATLKSKRQGRGYHYGYSVSSQPHGTSFGHEELRDGDVVRGEYRVQLPDGRVQVVTYTADGERGFLPVVRYEPASPAAATTTTTTHLHLPA